MPGKSGLSLRHSHDNNRLRADVMAEIVERTDGIPLFVEEMTASSGIYARKRHCYGLARDALRRVP